MEIIKGNKYNHKSTNCTVIALSGEVHAGIFGIGDAFKATIINSLDKENIGITDFFSVKQFTPFGDEEPFKYMTLFELIDKYQGLGVDIDFSNIALKQRRVYLSIRKIGDSTKPYDITYPCGTTESELVVMILKSLARMQIRQAVYDITEINKYNRGKINVKDMLKY
jgi:hypothetical protein